MERAPALGSESALAVECRRAGSRFEERPAMAKVVIDSRAVTTVSSDDMHLADGVVHFEVPHADSPSDETIQVSIPGFVPTSANLQGA
jgi:hypothetical protein